MVANLSYPEQIISQQMKFCNSYKSISLSVLLQLQ